MAEDQKRPEATHRQRADMATATAMSPVIGTNGRPMAIVTGTASDLLPTVQFGNLLVGPVQITRWVEDDGADSVIDGARATQQWAELVCGSERRLIQWALDPSKKIINPSTGQEMAPSAPAPAAPPAAPEPPAAPAPGQPVSFTEGVQPQASPGIPTPPPAQ
jgi:hypothetical protein